MWNLLISSVSPSLTHYSCQLQQITTSLTRKACCPRLLIYPPWFPSPRTLYSQQMSFFVLDSAPVLYPRFSPSLKFSPTVFTWGGGIVYVQWILWYTHFHSNLLTVFICLLLCWPPISLSLFMLHLGHLNILDAIHRPLSKFQSTTHRLNYIKSCSKIYSWASNCKYYYSYCVYTFYLRHKYMKCFESVYIYTPSVMFIQIHSQEGDRTA